MTAFRWGLLAGIAAALLAADLLQASIGQELYGSRFNVEILSRGADVSRAGGVKVAVADEQGMLAEQTCRDGCDDFELQALVGDNAFSVRVLDPAGRTLTYAPGSYVAHGRGAPITRWTVSGADVLRAQTSLLTRRADGTFEETPDINTPRP